jgi:hypothetical protein
MHPMPPRFSMTRQCEMVWPIIRGESYVGGTGKSMEVMGLAVSRRESGF